ncbi:MAG: hypothetical protein JXB34_00325 [Bacteroidales bacterium]|nr:hypothetical protein [Bacteroidales bacterium]
MKTLFVCFTAAFALAINATNAQRKNFIEYLNQLPEGLVLDNSKIRSYHITTDYLDYDLKGNFLRKTNIAGDYTCGLTDNSVRWNNVFVSSINDLGQPYSKKQDYLENYTYIPTTEILGKDFFSKMPEDEGMRMKNLFWDMFMLQGIAYWYWDSLKLNHDYYAEGLNTSVNLAGKGTFKNNDFKIKWLGITSINNEIYAIFKYSTMNNKVNVEMENLTMSGRSHYWGEIYVSLEDKHIEYATLTEDVITDLMITGQPRQIGYGVRHITLSRTK